MLTTLVMEQAETINVAWRYTSKRSDLLNALAATCLRQLEGGYREAPLFFSSVAAIRLARDVFSSSKEPITTLQKRLSELPNAFREQIFWADEQFTQYLSPTKDVATRLDHLCYEGLLQWHAARDGFWIRNNLGDKSKDSPTRQLLLRMAMQLCWDGTTAREDFARSLIPLIEDSRELRQELEPYLHPEPVNHEYECLQKRHQRHAEQQQRREAKDRASWIQFWRQVSRNPEIAFGAKQWEKTTWNLWHAARRSGEQEVSCWNRAFIERHFSKDIADRLRQSLMAFWRQDRPTLRCEREPKERNTYWTQWQLGLAGLYAEAEDPQWATKLSADEALLAMRYAPMELNHFPSWITNLAAVHPIAVKTILTAELKAELEQNDNGADLHQVVLNLLENGPREVVQLCSPLLRDWLNGVAVSNESQATLARLRTVIKVLLAQNVPEIAAAVKTKAAQSLAFGGSTPSAAIWLVALLKTSPAQGIAALAEVLEKLEGDQLGSAIHLIGGLFNDHAQHMEVDLSAPGFTPELLLQLLRIAYRYVSPREDIHHEGAFRPGPRDHAERARGKLLDTVLNLNGPEGWAIKQELAADPLFAHFRDRALFLATEKAAQEMDGRVYEVSDILDLYQTGEAAPSTHNELFALLRQRLEELEDMLKRDGSPRELWAGITEEKLMRRALAQELEHHANGIYTVDQERVTADEKETDIRLCISKTSLEAVIELKLGEKWSGKELRDALRQQIVAKYLGPEHRRVGCLLVTVAKDQHRKHPDSGTLLDTVGLQAMLQAEVANIEADMGYTLKLTAHVLDLRSH